MGSKLRASSQDEVRIQCKVGCIFFLVHDVWSMDRMASSLGNFPVTSARSSGCNCNNNSSCAQGRTSYNLYFRFFPLLVFGVHDYIVHVSSSRLEKSQIKDGCIQKLNFQGPQAMHDRPIKPMAGLVLFSLCAKEEII